MLGEVKKYGWILAILGTVLGIAAGDIAKTGVGRWLRLHASSTPPLPQMADYTATT